MKTSRLCARPKPPSCPSALTHPRPLAPTPNADALGRPLTPPLLRIEHQAEHVEAELRELETHPAELLLGLVTQHVRARGPEAGDGLPDRGVVGRRLPVHVPRVRDLAARRAVREVDLLVREAGERGHAKALRVRVDARVPEEREAVVVGGGDAGVVFEGLRAREGGEVVLLVEVFEHGRGCGRVVVGELDATALGRVVGLRPARGVRDWEVF